MSWKKIESKEPICISKDEVNVDEWNLLSKFLNFDATNTSELRVNLNNIEIFES